MRFFAQLNENNIVLNTSVGRDGWQSEGWVEFTVENPAYIGGDYLGGYFYAPQPYPSWSRNQGNWEAPVPYPNEGLMYDWNEELTDWKLRR